MERSISHLRLEEDLERVFSGFLLAFPRLMLQLRDIQVARSPYTNVTIFSRGPLNALIVLKVSEFQIPSKDPGVLEEIDWPSQDP